MDGRATLATIKSELRERVKALADKGSSPASAPVWSATTRPAAGTCRRSTGTALNSASPASSANSRPGPPRPRSRPSSTSSTPIRLHRLPGPATDRPGRVRDPEQGRPGQGRRRAAPVIWVRWCWASRRRCPARRSGIVELLRRYDVPINGAHAVVVGRGLTVGRPMGLLLTRRTRERHRHPVPHRHQEPAGDGLAGGHRGRCGRRPVADHRGHGQARRRGARCGCEPGQRPDRRRRRPGGDAEVAGFSRRTPVASDR